MISQDRPLRMYEYIYIHLILIGLILNALHGVLCRGFAIEVVGITLGPSKGGTQIGVHVTGDALDVVSPHYLRVNDWKPIKAICQTVTNGGLEDEFVMVPFRSSKNGVVRLSYSLDGVQYINVGEFVYYDGEQLAKTALHPAGMEGVWDLQNSIFPCTDMNNLSSISFTPTCKDEDEAITEARFPILYEYVCRSNAKLSIHCPVKSPKRITHISLNTQNYVAVEDSYREHMYRVQYMMLDETSPLTAIQSSPSPQLNPFPSGPAPDPSLPASAPSPPLLRSSTSSSFMSTTVNSSPGGHLQNGRRLLGSNIPVCTSMDTGMGLSILVMFPTPTTMDVNVTTDVAGSFIGIGGPMTYVVSVLVGYPGSYKLTSIVPPCAGITTPLSFNVSGPPSPQFSYLSSTFAPEGYAPGSSVNFDITVVDGQDIVPSDLVGDHRRDFPFEVTLLQSTTIAGRKMTYHVPFTTSGQANGIWQVTCKPTRFLPTTGSIKLNGLPIVNSQFNFSLQTLSASDAATKFTVSPNSSVPTGLQSLIIDAADTPTKYSLIHQINAQVIDPSGDIIVSGVCDMARTTVGCSFPMLFQKVGVHKMNVTIDSGTTITQISQISVMPGLALGSMSSFRLEGISSNNTQITAGNTVLARLNLADAYGNPAATTYSYGERNETVKVVLICDAGLSHTMAVIPGLGATNATAQVVTAGYCIVSAYIGSTGNFLQRSGIYGFNVNPNMGNTSGWKGNLVVGEMIAGVYTPVMLALKDCYGNVIDGSSLRISVPLTISIGNSNFPVKPIGRIFQVVPGLNQTVAEPGVIIRASYGSVELASYNATCLPGPVDTTVSNVTTSVQKITVGSNGTLTLNLLDSFGNFVVASSNFRAFEGSVLMKDDALGATILVLQNKSSTNPYIFMFTASTVAGHYYARIPVANKVLTTQSIITFVPGDPVGSNFGVSGAGSLQAQPGTNFTLFITARDQYNNIWRGDGSMLVIKITAGSFVVPPDDMTIAPDIVHGFSLTFKTPLTTGLCVINVRGFHGDFTSKTVIMRIEAGDLSSVGVEEVRQGVVNQPSSFYLVAQDARGFCRDNPTLPPDRFNVRLCQNETCGSATVNDKHTSGGRHQVTWSAPMIGDYKVDFWSPSGVYMPLTTLTVVASAGATRVRYYPRCHGTPPTLSTCPQFYKLIAGQIATLNLSSNDEPIGGPATSIGRGGNMPTVSFTGGQVLSLVDVSDGTYTLTYQAVSTVAFLDINNGVPDRISLLVSPGVTSPTRSSFRLGALLLEIYNVGDVFTGTFDANDAMGNLQDYIIHTPSKDVFKLFATNVNTNEITMGDVKFIPTNSGIFQATMVMVLAGDYKLQATFNDVPIPLIGFEPKNLGMECPFRVLPGPPEMTLMSYPPNSMMFSTTAGETGSIFVYSIRDSFGNTIPQNEVQCAARVEDAHGYNQQMQCESSDDHIVFTYSNLTKVGSYTFLYSVSAYGGQVDFSNPLLIAPTEPWPPACKVSTNSPVNTTVGSKTIMAIECMDRFNNTCLGDHSAQFVVVVTQEDRNTTVPVVVASNVQSITKQGQIIAYFYLRRTGNFSAFVRFRDIHGASIGSAVVVLCSPASTSVDLSFAYLTSSPRKLTSDNVPTRVAAGISNAMKIVGVDVNGNLQVKSECVSINVPLVTLSTDDVGFDGQGGGVAPLVTDPVVRLSSDSGCVFVFNFTMMTVNKVGLLPPSPAKYKLRIQWALGPGVAALDIHGSPFIFLVDPGPLHIPSTIISLQKREAHVTGLTTTFKLLTRDLNGNSPFYNQTLNVSAVVVPVIGARQLPEGISKSRASFLQSDDVAMQASEVLGEHNPSSIINPIVVNNLDTTYSISFTVLRAGPYNVFVYMNGILLQPNPQRLATVSWFMVVPGLPDLTQLQPSRIGDEDGKPILVGEPLHFFINICDNFGNVVNMSGKLDILDKYKAGISSRSTVSIQKTIGKNTVDLVSTPVANGSFFTTNGAIIYSCVPTTAGLLKILLSYDDFASTKVTESVLTPCHELISPSSVINVTSFKVFGPGVMASLACEDETTCYMNTLFVEIRDIYSNSIVPDKFLCSNFSLVGWNSSLMEAYPGRQSFYNLCSISYKVLRNNPIKSIFFNVSFESGSSSVLIPAVRRLSSVDPSGYAFFIPVISEIDDPEPRNCFAFGELGGMIMAGHSGQILVQLVDSSGLSIRSSVSSSREYVRLQIDPVDSDDVNYFIPLAPTTSSVDNGDGTFTLQYNAVKSGNFILFIYVGFSNKALGGKTDGYPLQVVSSATVIEKTLVTMTSNATINRAGQDWVRIEIQASDAYGNLQDYFLAPIDLFLAEIMQPDKTLATVALRRTGLMGTNGINHALWVLEFLPLQASPESVYTFSILWKNETTESLVPSSPMIIPTIPGPPSPYHTKVTGSGISVAHVGEIESLMIALFDALNNPICEIPDIVDANITATIGLEKSIIQTDANCTISSNPQGVLCYYMSTVPGRYILNIYSNEICLMMFGVNVGQGSIRGSNCVASGDGVGTTGMVLYPGLTTSFSIETYDYFNNSVIHDEAYFEVRGENQEQPGIVVPRPGFPSHVAVNEYKVEYTPLAAGVYDLHVERASVPIWGSPFRVEVFVGPVGLQCTLDEASLDPCPVGGVKNITLLSKDSFGNIRSMEFDTFYVFKTVDGFPSESSSDIMTPIGRGQYGYRFLCMNDTLVQITHDAMLVYEGKIGVVVGPADANKCTMTLESPVVKAGDIGKGIILSHDEGGHQLTHGGLVFKIQYRTASGYNNTMAVLDNGDGTYNVIYQVFASGVYFVVGEFNNRVFFSETLLVTPCPPNALQTVVDTDLNEYYVNVEGSFIIHVFDKYQNNITDSGALDTTTLSLFYVSSDFPSRTTLQPATNLLVDFDPETLVYTIRFTPSLPGILYINMKIEGEGILNYGSPYQAVVFPLPPDPSNFDVWGPGIESGAIKGETTFFYIRIRDAAGAAILSNPPDNFEAKISPASLVPRGAFSVYVGNGIKLFSYVAVKPSSKLEVALSYGGVRIQSFVNLQVRDYPGALDISQTVILGPDNVQISNSVPLVYRVGSPDSSLVFTIQPRDRNGFVIMNPDLYITMPVFTVIVTGGSVPVRTVHSDFYEWNYQFSIPSQTSAISMFVAVQSSSHGPVTDLKNSGFTILWMPGPSFPENTGIVYSSLNSGSSFSQIYAGQTLKITVQAFDEYYNPQVYCSESPDVFKATLNSFPSGDDMENSVIGLNNGDLTFDLILTVTSVGLYNVTIYLNGDRATSVPLTVVNAEMDLTAINLLTSLADPLVVGQPSFFVISAVDKFSNPVTNIGNVYTALKSQETGVNYSAYATALNYMIGQFQVMITPCKAGQFDVVVGSGSARSGGPGVTVVTVNVVPGNVNLNLTHTSIPVEVYTAGSLASFEIIALDDCSNPIYVLPQVLISQYDAPAYATSVLSPCSSAALTTTESDVVTCNPRNPLYTAKVLFMPITPGYLNISIFWDPENVINYNNVEVFPGSRPIALSATLSRNLGSIVVVFDTPTDAGYASFGGMHGAEFGWQRCNSTLDQSVMDKIGTRPNCFFTNAKSMVIQLGYNATIMPADSGIGDKVTIGNIFNQDDTSAPSLGWVPLGTTSFTPPPVAQLVGPTITGVCDNIILDASGSSGAAGRPLQYSYYVRGTGDPDKLAAIAILLESIPSEMVVQIGAGILDPDQTYLFEVIVTNYLGMSASAMLTMQTVRTPVPQLSIGDHRNLIEVMRWETVELEAHGRLSSSYTMQQDGVCALRHSKRRMQGQLSAPAPLSYEWSQMGETTLNPDSIGWKARSLNIPGSFLKPSVMYTFQVKCWPTGSPQLSSTASIAIQATQSPLTVIIVGGSRFANALEDLYLSANVYDPDDSFDTNIDELHPYEYEWSCDHFDLSTFYESVLYPDVVGSIKRTLIIPSSYLRDETTYTFTVTVARAPYTDKSRSAASANATIRTSTKAINIIVTVTNEPEVLAYGMSVSRLLRVTCSAGLGTYKWLVQSGADQRSKVEMGVEMIDGNIMRVKPGTLVPGAVYNFTCMATNSQGISGAASVSVKTLADPSGGTAELSAIPAAEHIAGETRYTLRAYGWTPGGDTIGPLRYEFRYAVHTSNGEFIKEVVLKPVSTANKVTDVFVSPGMVTFRIYVINPGPVRFMPNDAPHGTVFEFESIQVKEGRTHSLLVRSLLSNFDDFARRGTYFESLVAMDAYTSQTIPKFGRGCKSGGNKKVIKQMMSTIVFNDPQYPVASQGNAVQSGSGPYIALLTAGVFSKLVSRPQNFNLDEFKEALNIYMKKLQKVSRYGLKVPTTTNTPILTFLDTGDMFVKAVKMKCFKTGTQAQALMDQTSYIPILLAEMIYQNSEFESPSVEDRSMFTVGALGFKLPQNPHSPLGGPVYLSGQIGSFYATVTVNKGFGVEFGITAACFNKWSPMSSAGKDFLTRDMRQIKLLQVCDFSIVGLTPADLFTITITASFTNLKKIGRGYAYKAVQLGQDGIPDFDILRVVEPSITGVTFDFVEPYSRICLVKMKMDMDYSPVGLAGIHEKFKPPKNKFKNSVKLKDVDACSTTKVLSSTRLGSSTTRNSERPVSNAIFAMISLMVIAILNR